MDAVGGDLADLAEEHETISAVPVLNNIQPFVGLAAECLLPPIPAYEDGFDRAEDFTQRLVGRVRNFGSGKPEQGGLSISCERLNGSGMLEPIVIFLFAFNKKSGAEGK